VGKTPGSGRKNLIGESPSDLKILNTTERIEDLRKAQTPAINQPPKKRKLFYQRLRRRI
jgi:hypothetical protein